MMATDPMTVKDVRRLYENADIVVEHDLPGRNARGSHGRASAEGWQDHPDRNGSNSAEEMA